MAGATVVPSRGSSGLTSPTAKIIINADNQFLMCLRSLGPELLSELTDLAVENKTDDFIRALERTGEARFKIMKRHIQALDKEGLEDVFKTYNSSRLTLVKLTETEITALVPMFLAASAPPVLESVAPRREAYLAVGSPSASTSHGAGSGTLRINPLVSPLSGRALLSPGFSSPGNHHVARTLTGVVSPSETATATATEPKL